MDETQNTGTTRSKIIFGLLLFYALSTLISMAMMSIGVGAALLAFLLLDRKMERWRSAWKDRDFRWYCWLTLLLVLSAVLSLVSAAVFPLPYQEGESLGKYLKELRKLAYFVIPIVFFLSEGIFTRQKKSVFIRIFWLLLFVIGAIGVQQHWTAWPRLETITSSKGRFAAVGFMGLSLSVASVFSLAFFPAFNRTLSLWGERLRGENLKTTGALKWVENPVFMSVGCLLVLAMIFLTFSRMAWIALPMGVLLLVAYRFGKKAVLALPVLGLLLVAAFYGSPSVRERLQYSGGYSDRLLLWEGHLELFKQRPVLGVGWRQNSKWVDQALKNKYEREGKVFPEDFFQSHAHNVWIESLAGQGLLGTLAFLAWNVWFLSYLLRARLKSQQWSFWYVGAIVSLAVLHLNGLTQVNFWDSKVFHQVLLLVAMAFFLRPSASDETQSIPAR